AEFPRTQCEKVTGEYRGALQYFPAEPPKCTNAWPPCNLAGHHGRRDRDYQGNPVHRTFLAEPPYGTIERHPCSPAEEHGRVHSLPRGHPAQWHFLAQPPYGTTARPPYSLSGHPRRSRRPCPPTIGKLHRLSPLARSAPSPPPKPSWASGPKGKPPKQEL